MFEFYDYIILVLASSLRMSVPIILGAVGASFSTRVGVTAFGCEGMMVSGAFCGVYGALLTGSSWFGILFAICGGVIISMLHAYLHVTHRVNATLSGISINLIGLGLTELLLRIIWDSTTYSPQITSFDAIAPSWLVSIPFFGRILSQQYGFFYAMIVLVAISYVFMYKTKFGLRLRMVGEDPVAANSVGINTVRYKYFGVMLSGAFSGLAGAYLSMAMLSMFQTGMTAGRGYIAMVACSLSKSHPLGAAFSGMFFGFFDSLQIVFQGVNFPSQILMTLPYVFTLIASLIHFGKGRDPAGIGKHFDQG